MRGEPGSAHRASLPSGTILALFPLACFAQENRRSRKAIHRESIRAYVQNIYLTSKLPSVALVCSPRWFSREVTRGWRGDGHVAAQGAPGDVGALA